jgi:hypothetical protein
MDERGKREQKLRQEQRLRAALRENLKRRKAQAKGRANAPPQGQTAASHDSAGIPEDKRGG